MKTVFTLAVLVAFASSLPASAAGITPADCAAIRGMAKSLAESNLDAMNRMLKASKSSGSLLIIGFKADPSTEGKISDYVKEMQETLTAKGLDTQAFVAGMTVLNKVCPN